MKTAHIIGKGPINYDIYKAIPQQHFSIAINDAAAKHQFQPWHVLIMDNIFTFNTNQVLDIINNPPAKSYLSQFRDWGFLRPFSLFKVTDQRAQLGNIENRLQLPWGITPAYTAAIFAYQFLNTHKHTDIILHGISMTDPLWPNPKDQHFNQKYKTEILHEFTLLNTVLQCHNCQMHITNKDSILYPLLPYHNA